MGIRSPLKALVDVCFLKSLKNAFQAVTLTLHVPHVKGHGRVMSESWAVPESHHAASVTQLR